MESIVKQGDCIKLMQEFPDSCVDLVITDPPFGIGFEAFGAGKNHSYNRDANQVLRGYNEVSDVDYGKFTKAWLSEATRMLKETGSMYIFSGYNNLKDILIAIDECNLFTVNHLVWKYGFGVVTHKKYVTSHYHCLYVCKDDDKRIFYPYCRFKKEEKTDTGGSARYKDIEDVWSIDREYWRNVLKTPTKLPRRLIEKILAYSSKEGDVVMDPFLGSGQTAVVSKLNGRKYVGFEIVPDYFKFISKRLDTGKYLLTEYELEQDYKPDIVF